MLHGYALNVSFLGAFIVLISLFAPSQPVFWPVRRSGASPMLKEGYEKVICLNPGPYVPSSHRTDDAPTFRQDPGLDGLASGPELIDDIGTRRAPPDVLFRRAAVDEYFQGDLRLGRPKELIMAIEFTPHAEWIKPLAWLVSDSEASQLNFHGIVSRMLPNNLSKIQQEIELIRPMVEERFAKMEEYGKDWDYKPVPWYLPYYNYVADIQNDLLMWLMTEAKGVETSIEGIARRLLVANFAGIHVASVNIAR